MREKDRKSMTKEWIKVCDILKKRKGLEHIYLTTDKDRLCAASYKNSNNFVQQSLKFMQQYTCPTSCYTYSIKQRKEGAYASLRLMP